MELCEINPQSPKPGHWRDLGLEANANAGDKPHTLKGVKCNTQAFLSPKKQAAQWRNPERPESIFLRPGILKESDHTLGGE